MYFLKTLLRSKNHKLIKPCLGGLLVKGNENSIPMASKFPMAVESPYCFNAFRSKATIGHSSRKLFVSAPTASTEVNFPRNEFRCKSTLGFSSKISDGPECLAGEVRDFMDRFQSMVTAGNAGGAADFLNAKLKAVKENVIAGRNGVEETLFLEVIELSYLVLRNSESLGSTTDAGVATSTVPRPKLKGIRDGEFGSAMLTLAQAKLALGDVEKAIRLYKTAFPLLKVSRDENSLDRKREEIKKLFYDIGGKGKPQDFQEEFLEMADESDMLTKVLQAFFDKVNPMILAGNKDDASNFLIAKLEAVKEKLMAGHKGSKEALVLDFIVLSYIKMGDLESARSVVEVLAEVIESVADMNSDKHWVFVLGHMSYMHTRLGKPELTVLAVERIVGIFEANAYPSKECDELIGTATLQLASLKLVVGQSDEAFRLCKKATRLLKSSMDENSMNEIRANFAKLLYDAGRETEGLELLEEGLEVINQKTSLINHLS